MPSLLLIPFTRVPLSLEISITLIIQSLYAPDNPDPCDSRGELPVNPDKLDFAIVGEYDVLFLSVKVHSDHKVRNVKPGMDYKI